MKPQVPFGWKAALEQERFGVFPCSLCWVRGGEADPPKSHGWGLRRRRRGLEKVSLLLSVKVCEEQGHPRAGTCQSRDIPEQGQSQP